ncbi:hypothetical protein L7F22_017386 [Adiantum nelumboides]|nr:hypothetical protein [Adiantum nelumboides]
MYAYIANFEANKAWLEEKKKQDEETARSSKRATKSSNKKEEVPTPMLEVNMEDAPKDKKQGKPRGHSYKLRSDIELATDLKTIFEERILNSKVEMTLGDILGIAKHELHEEIIDIIKRKRQIPSDQELEGVKSQKVKPQGEEVLPSPEPVKLEEAHSLYFDGAYKRIIDKAAVGVVVFDEEGQKIFSTSELLKNSHCNNEAEYAALILGLEWCVNNKIHHLNVYGDAMLLVKKIKGIWACKNHSFLNHLKQVKELMRHFQAVKIHHVPRMQNQEADALASEKLLAQVVIGAIVLKEPLFQSSDCMQDIVDFLNSGECPGGLIKGQRQWLVCKATRFGTPLEIISDRGLGFRGDLVGELMEQLGISRISFKTNLGYTPYHLVFGNEAILPIKVQLASLRVLKSGRDRKSEQLRSRILELERLEHVCRAAIEHYAAQAMHRKQKFDENLKDKRLKRGMLVLRYDNRFDTRKDKKFMVRWEGPFLIYTKYTNGSYKLQEISGKLHKTWVNGWRLKHFFQRFDSSFMFDLPAGTREDEEEQPSSSHRHQH